MHKCMWSDVLHISKFLHTYMRVQICNSSMVEWSGGIIASGWSFPVFQTHLALPWSSRLKPKRIWFIYIYIYIIYKHKTQTDTCVQTRRHEFPYCRHLLLNLAKMVVHDLACFDNFRNMDLHLVCNQNNPWWSQLPPEWCLVVPI